MELKKVLELNELFKICRLHNVTKLKSDTLSIEFGALPQEAIPVMDGPLKESIGGEMKPTADQLLYWSTGEELTDIEAKPPEI